MEHMAHCLAGAQDLLPKMDKGSLTDCGLHSKGNTEESSSLLWRLFHKWGAETFFYTALVGGSPLLFSFSFVWHSSRENIYSWAGFPPPPSK